MPGSDAACGLRGATRRLEAFSRGLAHGLKPRARARLAALGLERAGCTAGCRPYATVRREAQRTAGRDCLRGLCAVGANVRREARGSCRLARKVADNLRSCCPAKPLAMLLSAPAHTRLQSLPRLNPPT